MEWIVMMRHEGKNTEVDGKVHTLEQATLLANTLNRLPKPASTFFYPKRIKTDFQGLQN